MTPTDTVAYSTTTDLVLVYECRTYVRLLYSKYAYAYGTRRQHAATNGTVAWHMGSGRAWARWDMDMNTGRMQAGMDVDRWLSWNKIIIVHR